MGEFLFAAPDFPAGTSDYASLTGIEEDDPFVTGPAVGGYADTTTGGAVGLTHVATGAAQPTTHRQQHWSNLLDWKHGPLFWLAVATILYFGLISVQVSTRLGR